MLEFINIKPYELTNGDKLKLMAICLSVFREHHFRLESNGIIRMTKETWANPESFEMHWYQLVITVLPTFVLKYKSSVARFHDDCVKRFCSWELSSPIDYLYRYIPETDK